MDNSRYGVNISNRFVLQLEDEDPGDPDDIIIKYEPVKQIVGDKPKQKQPSTLPAVPSSGNHIKVKNTQAGKDKNETKISPGWRTVTGHTKQSRSLKQNGQKVGAKSESIETNRKNENISLPDSGLEISAHGIEITSRRGRGSGQRLLRGTSRKIDTFNQRGKREFDRLSGSNKSKVKPMDKRDGGGAHNWGKPTVQIEFPDTEEKSGDEGMVIREQKEENAPEKDKDEWSMTLDEWRGKQEKRNIPAFNLRKPGEGESEKWQETYILKKKEESEEEEEGSNKKSKQKPPAKDLSDMLGGLKIVQDAPPSRKPSKWQKGFNPVDAPKKVEAPKMDDLDDFPIL